MIREIPIQLKDCRFCKVGSKKRVEKDIEELKRPFEMGWTKRIYDYETASQWRKNPDLDFINYGVIAGINDLGIFDDDSHDKRLMKLYHKHFPKTYRVRDHNYIFLKGWNGNKITFNDGGKKIGEVQGRNTQAVSVGSKHPSGETYELVNDLPIVEIDFKEFQKVFNIYMKQISITPKPETSDWKGDDIKDIPITSIFSSELVKCPSCGCKSGTNFQVYPESNSYFCYHEWTGGGIWEAIAISERIKSCSDIGISCLSESESRQILEVAYNKYGLRKPVKQIIQYEPRGWALSLNIKSIAKKRNMLSCPKCNVSYDFNEELGWFKCNCSKGGIKKFMALCLMEAQQ